MENCKKTVFSGVGTALVTPFRNGEIDYDAFDDLIEMQILADIPALIIGGTTGEAATLSEEERYTLYEHATEKIRHRAKVILGTGTNDTRVVINHTRFAESIGADAALVVTPYYNKGTEEGVFRHYSAVAEATSIPLILYNVPSRTGVNLGLNLLSRLAAYPNIVGLKEAGDSTDRLVALAEFRDTIPLYAGNDSQIYPTLALGGRGVISVASNIVPTLVKKITDSYFCEDTKGALEAQLLLLPFIRSLFMETNPAPIKHVMAAAGIIDGELRLPLYEARESTKTAVLREYLKIKDIL